MSTTNIALWDYDVNDNLDSETGEPTIPENADAVKNAFTSWCKTGKGEILNDPEAGGSIDDYTFKQFTENQKMRILFDFRSQIDTYFTPKLKIVELGIDSDKFINAWKLKVKYYIPSFNVTKINDLPLKRIQYKSIFGNVTENINFSGNTLLNFVKIYLYENRGYGLKNNGTHWTWNNFVFTELLDTDENFETIQNLINSNKDQ